MIGFGNAHKVGDLVKLLQRFKTIHGYNSTWNGWDDGSLILYPEDKNTPHFYISNDEEENAKAREVKDNVRKVSGQSESKGT